MNKSRKPNQANGDGLSKTLSKDNLASKLKKANLLNAGNLIKKNIISQNY